MTPIAGCDPSSKKLAVVVDHDDHRITTHVWQSAVPKWDPTACLSASEWVLCEFGGMPAGVIWIEEPLVGRGGAHPTIVQSFISGAAQAAWGKLGWDVRLVNVSVWKRRVVGTGGANKDDIGHCVAERWPAGSRAASGDGDLIDAAAIALYGRDVHAVAAQLGMAGSSSLHRED